MEYLPGIIAIGAIIAFALIGFVGLPYLLFFGGKGSINPPENDGRDPPRSQIGEARLHGAELFMWVPVLRLIPIFIFAMIFTAVVPAAIFLDRGRSLSAAVMPIIFMSWGVNFMAYAATSPWRRKRSLTVPLIVIDDAGLWLRDVGEQMPWAEIESVEQCPAYSDGLQIVVVWKKTRYPIRPIFYMDRNATYWGVRRIFDEINSCWKRKVASPPFAT
jgi:hypothetical protein